MRPVRKISLLSALLLTAACSRQRPDGGSGRLNGDTGGMATTAAPSGPNTPASMALSDADAAAVLSVDSVFAAGVRAGDAGAVANAYADDAVLMPPDMKPIKGRASIQEYWAGFFKSYTVEPELGMDEMDGRGDLAYSRGHYYLEVTPKAKGVPRMAPVSGKFLEVLRRQPDGSWQYTVDMFSANAPPGRR